MTKAGGFVPFLQDEIQQQLDRHYRTLMAKKRRPTDSTMRNVRSAKTQIGALRFDLMSLKLAVRNLERRVLKLERGKK